MLNLKRYLLYYRKKILTNENITALINLRLLLSSDHTLWNAVAQYFGYILKIQWDIWQLIEKVTKRTLAGKKKAVQKGT